MTSTQYRKRILVKSTQESKSRQNGKAAGQGWSPYSCFRKAGQFLKGLSHTKAAVLQSPLQRKGQDLQECVTNSHNPQDKDGCRYSLLTCWHFHHEETPCRKSRIWADTRPHLSLRDTATSYQGISFLFENALSLRSVAHGDEDLFSLLLLATTPAQALAPTELPFFPTGDS